MFSVAKLPTVIAPLTIAALALLSGGCCRALGAIAGATAETFSGNYMTNWGVCSLSQAGSQVSGTCVRGTTMSCVATGAALACDWKENGGSGKALLSKQPSGALMGTWGKGASATNGGPWTFNPQK